jgi:hypothetical protein
MKVFFVGLWIAAVTLVSTCAAAYMAMGHKSTGTEQASAVSLQLQKTRVLNVPIIAGGVVQGFIVAQFSFTIDPNALKQLSVPPEVFLLDEAFRTIYTDDKLDFKHLEKYDVNKLTSHLAEETNKRLGTNLIKEVLIQDLTFISKIDDDK